MSQKSLSTLYLGMLHNKFGESLDGDLLTSSSFIICQMMRVISSPSISTRGVRIRIFLGSAMASSRVVV